MEVSKETSKPGPDPDRLNLDEEDWREAVRKALSKKKSPGASEPEGQPDDSTGGGT